MKCYCSCPFNSCALQSQHGRPGQHGHQRFVHLLAHLHGAPPPHGGPFVLLLLPQLPSHKPAAGALRSALFWPSSSALQLNALHLARLTHSCSALLLALTSMPPCCCLWSLQRHHINGAYKPTDFFETAAMLITLVLFGKYLESAVRLLWENVFY